MKVDPSALRSSWASLHTVGNSYTDASRVSQDSSGWQAQKYRDVASNGPCGGQALVWKE